MMIQFKILELFQKGHFKISFTLKLSMLWTSLEGRNLDRPVLPSPLHPQKKRGECLFLQLAYLREVDATEFFLAILERIGLNWSRVGGGGVDCSEIKLTLILCHTVYPYDREPPVLDTDSRSSVLPGIGHMAWRSASSLLTDECWQFESLKLTAQLQARLHTQRTNL